MRRTVLTTAALAALLAGCTPTSPADPTSAPLTAEATETAPATSAGEFATPAASPTAAATDGEVPAFALDDVVDPRGVLFLTEIPDGLTEGDGYPDQSGWRTLAEGTCTLSVRELPMTWPGDAPVYYQEESQTLLIANAAQHGLVIEPRDVADLPLASGRSESGEAMFAEARGEGDGGFLQLATRVTDVALEGGADQTIAAELRYTCPTEDDYTETWQDVAAALEVGVWTSELWWGGN